MQKLNKKLFADFKNTPATEKISFILKNAEALINTKLFDDCLKTLETVGPEILQKKNGVEKHKEFEIARKRLVNLPLEIEKRKKQEAARIEEMRNDIERIKVTQKKENDWLERLAFFKHTLTERIVSDLKITHKNHWIEFEELKYTKPEGLTEFKLDTYQNFIKQFPPYKEYQNKKRAEIETKRHRKTKILRNTKWIGSGISLLIVLGLGSHWYHKKTKAAQDQFLKEDIMRAKLMTHELTENRIYFKKHLKASSDTLFSVIDLPDQKQLSVLADTYLTTLRGFVESINYHDAEDLDLLISEVDKISKNFGKLLHFSLGSNSISVNSIDEMNKAMQNQIDPHERLIFKKIEIYSLLGRSFVALAKGFEFRNDKLRALSSLKEAKKFYNKVLDLNPQDSTADQNLMLIERSLKN